MSAAIAPHGNVPAPDANLKKRDEIAATFFQRFTPDPSPEPPDTVIENENGVQMMNRRAHLITQIKTDAFAEPKNPFKVLGAKSTEQMRSRLPKLKEVLEEEIGKGTDGAQDALDRTLLELLLLSAKLIHK
jgi:hypothetical protein